MGVYIPGMEMPTGDRGVLALVMPDGEVAVYEDHPYKARAVVPDGVRPVVNGKWEIIKGVLTPGGDPVYVCPFCHSEESEHLGGIENPRRWYYCPVCGASLEVPT